MAVAVCFIERVTPVTKEKKQLSVSQLDDLQSSGAGYEILRYVGLPELLGTESETLLYFIGRNLARKLEITSLDDVYLIFDKLGWGHLELVREQKKELTFHLMADSVAKRIKSPFPTDFRMEAGFLAEALQCVKEVPCECVEEIHQKIFQVELSVVYT